jgi:hypothetical protein
VRSWGTTRDTNANPFQKQLGVGRGEFQQAIGNLNVKIAELQTQGTSTQGILQDFTAIAQSRRTEVDSVFDKLIDDLETRRASLHQQIDAMVEKKSSLLNNQFHSGEQLKHTMEELRDRCGDWKAITNDSQCLMKLLESKKELTKVNQLFVSNRESFANLIPSGLSDHHPNLLIVPSVRPLIETYLPSTDDWKISQFGGVCDQKLSETSSILQRSSPDSTPVLNGAVMKLKILLRDTNGSKYAYTSSVKPITVSWRVRNLEQSTFTDLDIKCVRTIDGELEYSYTIPFFDHVIRCSVNGNELSESRLKIQLSSISEDMKCVFCQHANAVQAHALQSNATNQYRYGYNGRDDLFVQLKGSDKKYLGICSQHVPWIENGQMSRSYQLNVDKTPQKCNLAQPQGRK